MKRAVIIDKLKAGLVDASDPHAIEDWALVKVLAAPMCTEYKRFLSGPRADYLGHEAVGEVVQVAQPGKVQVGERVVVMPQYPCGKCNLCVAGDYIHCEHTIDFEHFTDSREGSATYAQYVLKPSWLLPKIPEGVSYELASLSLCALGPTFGAMESMGTSAFDSVLITGAGPVGLGGVVNATHRGARVVVLESIPYRMERAYGLGAHLVLEPSNPDALAEVMKFTDGLGVDQAIDCSGVVEAQRFCIQATRRKGKVAFVGECQANLHIQVSPDMIRKGLTVSGVWHYNLAAFPRIMHVIRNSTMAEQLISHVFPMSEIQKALEISAAQQCAKIILKPWE